MYSSNSTAAQEWARKRREKIERAKELREARKREREAGPYEGGFGSCAAGGDVDNAAPDYDFGPAPTRADPSPPRDRGGYDRGPPPVQPRANAGPRAAPPYTKPTSQPSSGSLGGYGASGRYQPPPLYYFDDQGSAKKAFEIPQPKPNVNYVPDDPRDPANYGNRPLGDYEAPRRHAEDADGTWTTTLRGALPDNDLQPARAKSRADKSRNAPRRPEWNNDFVEDFSLGAPPEPEPAPAPAPRRTVRKAPPRPDWNNEFAEPETTVDGAFPAAPPPRPSPGAQASSGRINRQGLARLKDRMAGRRAGGSAGSGGSATPSPAPSRGPSERARPAQPPAPSRGPSNRARPPATDEEYRAPARSAAPAPARGRRAPAPAPRAARAPHPAENGAGNDDVPLPRAPAIPEGADDAPPARLIQCRSCGRSFNEQALAKHAKVCQKVFQTKRKAFDSTRHRLAGTDAAQVAPRGGRGGAGRGRAGAGADRPIKPAGGGKGGKWRQQSEAFRAAMRAARGVTEAIKAGKDPRDIPVVPSQPDPDLVPCPHCGRTFNEKAAERHIPKCTSIMAKPKMLRAGGGRGGGGARGAPPRGRMR